MGLLADPSEGVPMIPYLSTDPDESPAEVLWNCLKKRALEAGFLPDEICVASDIAEATLEGLKNIAGIQVVRRANLQHLNALFAKLSGK